MEKKKDTPHINVDYFEELTGTIDQPSQEGVDEVGARIAKIRREKGLSLEELSNLTGFEIDLLAKIEQNQVKPQLGTVLKLSKALDSAFGRLLSGVGKQLYTVTRKSEQKVISRSTSKTGQQQLYVYKSLASEVKGRHMEALLVQLEQVPDEEMSVHDGEEFIYVMEGIVVLKIGDDLFELEPGDSAYYLSTTPHLLSAQKDRAVILAVVYEGGQT